MRRDQEDRDLLLVRPVMPEHAPSRRVAVLDVRLPDILPLEALLVVVLMRLQPWISRVRLNAPQACPDLPQLDQVLLVAVVLELMQRLPRLSREEQSKRQSYDSSSTYWAKLP